MLLQKTRTYTWSLPVAVLLSRYWQTHRVSTLPHQMPPDIERALATDPLLSEHARALVRRFFGVPQPSTAAVIKLLQLRRMPWASVLFLAQLPLDLVTALLRIPVSSALRDANGTGSPLSGTTGVDRIATRPESQSDTMSISPAVEGTAFSVTVAVHLTGSVYQPDGTCILSCGNGNRPVRISRKDLDDNHITVQQRLGQGTNGAAYRACVEEDCDAVVKVGQVNEQELEIAAEMSKYGIGPHIIAALQCDCLPLETGDKPPETIDLIAMQQLTFTLDEWIRLGAILTASDAIRLAQLIQSANNLGLYHFDLKPDNIMIEIWPVLDDLQVDRFYLIDFGVSYYHPIHKAYVYEPINYVGWPRLVPTAIENPIAIQMDLLLLIHHLRIYYLHRGYTSATTFVTQLEHYAREAFGVNPNQDLHEYVRTRPGIREFTDM